MEPSRSRRSRVGADLTGFNVIMQFEQDDILLLDGATGTELDRRGVDVSLPLWSARAMLEAPEVLLDVHRSYLDAGAGAICTNTFRTHERSLAKAGLVDHAERLTREAYPLHAAARDEVNQDALVLGSVAPLEDCYSPGRAADVETCRHEHAQLIRYLVDGGVDLVLVETMCSAHEALAAASAAEDLAPGNWAISFCLAPDDPGVLLDGTLLADLLPKLGQARFIGINCVAAPMMTDQVKHLHSLLHGNIPIAAYGNVGHPDDERGWVNTDAIDPDRYAEHAMEWRQSQRQVLTWIRPC